MKKSFIIIAFVLTLLISGCVKKTEINKANHSSQEKENVNENNNVMDKEPVLDAIKLNDIEIEEIKSSGMKSIEFGNSISGAQIESLDFDLADVSLPVAENEAELEVPNTEDTFSLDDFNYKP